MLDQTTIDLLRNGGAPILIFVVWYLPQIPSRELGKNQRSKFSDSVSNDRNQPCKYRAFNSNPREDNDKSMVSAC